MRIEDFKKLATGPVLFDLNRIIAPRVVTIFYFLGLAAILLWAINHFFYSFSFGFGNGLWGLLEIAVFGLLALFVLRIACEAVIVFFRAHQAQVQEPPPVRHSASLIDDVRDAIEELADEDPSEPEAPTATAATPAAPAPATAPQPAPKTSRPAPARKTGAAAKSASAAKSTATTKSTSTAKPTTTKPAAAKKTPGTDMPPAQ